MDGSPTEWDPELGEGLLHGGGGHEAGLPGGGNRQTERDDQGFFRGRLGGKKCKVSLGPEE